MSKKATEKNPAHEDALNRARAEFGKVVSVVIDGELLIFRRPKRPELVVMNKAARKQPELAIEHAIGLCRTCHVGPGPNEDVDRFANEYTLLFAGSDDYKGISDHLIELSRGEYQIALS